MIEKHVCAMLLAASLLTWTSAVCGQNIGSVTGYAYDRVPDMNDQKQGIPGVKVEIKTADGRTIEAKGKTTTATGYYEVEDVPAGDITVKFQRQGWVDNPTEKDETKKAGQAVSVNAELMKVTDDASYFKRFASSVIAKGKEQYPKEWLWLYTSNAPASSKVLAGRACASADKGFATVVPVARPYLVVDVTDVKRAERQLKLTSSIKSELRDFKNSNAKIPQFVLADIAVHEARLRFDRDSEAWQQFSSQIEDAWGKSSVKDVETLMKLDGVKKKKDFDFDGKNFRFP